MASYDRIRPGVLRSTVQITNNGETGSSDTVSPTIGRTLAFRSSLVKGDHVLPTNYDFIKTDSVAPSGALGRLYEEPRSGWDKYSVRTEQSGAFGQISGFRRVHEDESGAAALSKLYAKIRGGLDLSVGIGEHASTTKMLRTAASFGKTIVKLHPKHFAANWLEFTYGWKPLMSDLFATVEEVNRVAEKSKTFEARATVVHDDEYKSQGNYNVIDVQLQSNRTKYVVLLNPSQTTISNVARFTSLNPASIAWELTPMSFVFDWFVDVGGYLRDLESSLAYSGTFQSGYATYTQKLFLSRETVGSGMTDGALYYGHTSGYLEQRSLTRRALSGLPMPQSPRFRPQLGASRLISAAALLKVLFLHPKAPPLKIRRSQVEIQQRLNNLARGPRKWPKDDVYSR